MSSAHRTFRLPCHGASASFLTPRNRNTHYRISSIAGLSWRRQAVGPVSDHELAKIESSTLFDRRHWLDRLAHSQSTMPEIENGGVRACFRIKIAELL